MPQSAIPPGRHAPVRPEWLAKRQEEAIEPQLPIVDPHHHMWDRPGNRYLFEDLLADVGSGHNVVATCFEECREMYRADGPQELKSLGETEFVNGIAAMSASGKYGATRCIAGIIGNVDLRIGSRAKGILEQHVAISGGRFKGIRNGATWHDDPSLQIYCSGAPQGLYRDAKFREGFAGLAAWRPAPSGPDDSADTTDTRAHARRPAGRPASSTPCRLRPGRAPQHRQAQGDDVVRCPFRSLWRAWQRTASPPPRPACRQAPCHSPRHLPPDAGLSRHLVMTPLHCSSGPRARWPDQRQPRSGSPAAPYRART